MRAGVVAHEPVALAEKPKRLLRISLWLEREEQATFEAALKDRRNIPINIFGNNKTRMTETRRRYEMLFGLLLHCELRISEALALKLSDVRLVEGVPSPSVSSARATRSVWCRYWGSLRPCLSFDLRIGRTAQSQSLRKRTARRFHHKPRVATSADDQEGGHRKEAARTSCGILTTPTCSTLARSWWTSRPYWVMSPSA